MQDTKISQDTSVIDEIEVQVETEDTEKRKELEEYVDTEVENVKNNLGKIDEFVANLRKHGNRIKKLNSKKWSFNGKIVGTDYIIMNGILLKYHMSKIEDLKAAQAVEE